ncbi:MAG: flavin reductase family protein [Pseudomonadota bacterium]
MFYEPKDGHGLPHDPFKAIVAPRPIGWVSTLDTDGRANLAPYSFFNGCGDRPPYVMFAQTGPKKPGGLLVKDTVTNCRETGEFACSLVSLALRDAMNASTEAFDAGVDEFEKAGLAKGAGRAIKAPHVADAPAVLECRTHQVVELPAWKEDWLNIVVIGEVVGVHVDEEHLKDGHLDVTSYNPIARMGYLDYTTVTERWEMPRPESEAWQAKFR